MTSFRVLIGARTAQDAGDFGSGCFGFGFGFGLLRVRVASGCFGFGLGFGFGFGLGSGLGLGPLSIGLLPHINNRPLKTSLSYAK